MDKAHEILALLAANAEFGAADVAGVKTFLHASNVGKTVVADVLGDLTLAAAGVKL